MSVGPYYPNPLNPQLAAAPAADKATRRARTPTGAEMASRRAAFDIEDEDDDDDAASTDHLTASPGAATPAGRRAHAQASARPSRRPLLLAAGALLLVAVALLARGVANAGSGAPPREPGSLKLVSWNVAAINNNPFEYWITHDAAEYTRLMADVQAFVDTPGEADVPLSSVLTAPMVSELAKLMAVEGWERVDDAVAHFTRAYGDRPIISGFLRDGELGKKRLVSMPDRLTNTINTRGGGLAHRPTVINCYGGAPFLSEADWWAAWKRWMFAQSLELASGRAARPAELLGPISRAKYPALTADEEALSRPLSALALAAFDAVLVHVMMAAAGGAHLRTWQPLRAEMCGALNAKKNARTAQILASPLYADADAIFVQEVAGAFVHALRTSPLGREFDVRLASTADGKRDQNSAILLRRSRFNLSTLVERTAELHAVLAQSGGAVPVEPGDVLVVTVDEAARPAGAGAAGAPARFVLGSFHGDTNGLATVPVLRALAKLAATPALAGHTLLFGLDANTYEARSAKTQHVLDFADAYGALGLTSCWGDRPDPHNHTTFNARTYLQPQLNKAVKLSDLAKPGVGDKNPKDFILFPKGSYALERTAKDNTGRGAYLEQTVFPTLAFPSDHALISTVLRPLARASA
ncbi:hypothetical protein KFE25_003080 [Diacronema lutheri]|uniref:Endonuclease/exonuclease/phosphatase domain-containing protein n=1 Tax=Diacronema lutheri TaxID=2081491 RepID=A0A8J5XD19_DIALT|nr:hypothetical protein KFE25_003080 [Diacronema lutheri]